MMAGVNEDTAWPAGAPNEAKIRADIARSLEEVPCSATIMRGDLESLDNIVSFFVAMASFIDCESMYDDLWNIRNRLVPFKEGEQHFNAEACG